MYEFVKNKFVRVCWQNNNETCDGETALIHKNQIAAPKLEEITIGCTIQTKKWDRKNPKQYWGVVLPPVLKRKQQQKVMTGQC